MKASDRDKDLFFRLMKTQRSSSFQSAHTLHTEEKEASAPEDINNLFKDHFSMLAQTNSNSFFNEKHDNLVKLDVESIVYIFENEEITIQPITSSEISKLISLLKRKKSIDVDGLSSEHLIYGGSALAEYLTTLLNNILYTKHVPAAIKKGPLTPVHKKDKDPTVPSNHRGVTVISIICQVLELCIRPRVEGTLIKHQNKLHKGFTKGASSINIALLITEAINETKDNNECLILITVDAEKAFDVVENIHLFWKTINK
ncbi:unnamed protein product [Mytilus coruscus]|uniref:Reverse transcriptase domain-containing protein n=1 Tax=Mytilus coruscus TaxID=42192 RepID=A0A6J8EAA4_MYTCO|nr:unnamed protein product [Mytilus coruscus]